MVADELHPNSNFFFFPGRGNEGRTNLLSSRARRVDERLDVPSQLARYRHD